MGNKIKKPKKEKTVQNNEKIEKNDFPISNENKINKIENKNIKIPNLKLTDKNFSESYCYWGLGNSFIVINLDNKNYIIYATKNKSLIFYNLDKEKKEKEIKNAHTGPITDIAFCKKNSKNKNLIMSVSGSITNIKLWDINSLKCLFNLNAYNMGNIFSSCFFNYDNNNYIITSNGQRNELIFYNLSGKIYKSMNLLDHSVFCIDYFYDKKKLKYYIITGNNNYITSYDFEANQLYKQYKPSGEGWHGAFKVYQNEFKIKLLDSCWQDDFLRIWDFHLGTLLSKIKTGGNNIKCISIFNSRYIFVGCADHSIKLIDTKINMIITNLIGHKEWVTTIKKIFIPNYGICILTQGLGEKETIKIWKTLH